MEEIEKLRREKQRLINRRKSKEEIKAFGIERKKLRREIKELKHPVRTAIKKRLFSSKKKKPLKKMKIKYTPKRATKIRRSARRKPSLSGFFGIKRG